MSLMQMSVTGSCLIIAIAVFRAVFFRRLPKRTLVWLWIGAALALLIPLRLIFLISKIYLALLFFFLFSNIF